MTLSREERETIINFSDNGNDCNIYTCNSALIRKMDKLVEKYPEECSVDEVFNGGKSFNYDKKYITIRSPRISTKKQISHLSKVRKI